MLMKFWKMQQGGGKVERWGGGAVKELQKFGCTIEYYILYIIMMDKEAILFDNSGVAPETMSVKESGRKQIASASKQTTCSRDYQ